MRNTRRKMWFFAALSVLAVAFIFMQSIRSAPASQEESNRLLDLLRTLFDPKGVFFTDRWTTIIRKIAHFTEFAALGVLVGAFSVSLGALRDQKLRSLPLLLCLLVAVVDETLQTFVAGRSGEVRDVLLDFGGVAVGVTAALLIARARGKNKRNNG
ncbi:MAG: VanZ family protein [Oscillospiraceae bacterium]|nr:VanZ family protein [Oscillospiraceae bacterium]